MLLKHDRIGSLCVITLAVIGITLRVCILGLPDISTDEAQFILGTSAAQPPVGMALFRLSQAIFGHNVIAVRIVSVICGLITVGLLSYMAKIMMNRDAAIITAIVALLFPSHILFSRLAYLSAPLTMMWVATLVAFLIAEKKNAPIPSFALYASSIILTFIKTQALLLPCALLLLCIIRKRKKVFSDPNAWMLFLSLFPIGIYILAHPGIAATLMQYGGNQYGFINIGERVMDLLQSWWSVFGFGLLGLVFALPSLRSMRIEWWILLTIGVLTGFVLGPENRYYTIDLVLLALPISFFLLSWKGMQRIALLISVSALFVVCTFVTIRRDQQNNYWFTHADDINGMLKSAGSVVVLGNAGHHVRWYLVPQVLVGNEMDLTDRKGFFVLLDPKEASRVPDAVSIYDDGMVQIVRR